MATRENPALTYLTCWKGTKKRNQKGIIGKLFFIENLQWIMQKEDNRIDNQPFENPNGINWSRLMSRLQWRNHYDNAYSYWSMWTSQKLRQLGMVWLFIWYNNCKAQLVKYFFPQKTKIKPSATKILTHIFSGHLGM